MAFTRQSLLAGDPQLGTWLNLGSPFTPEIAGLAGFHWVLLDREHGGGDENSLAFQIMAAQCGNTAAIVRVSGIHPAEIKRALDFGPAGIMVPSIDTAAQAQQVLRAVRIPPLGDRGAASSTRASRYGFGYQHYLETANETLVTMLQIESQTAVDNAGAIAAVDGADVLFVGPTDLSIDMNLDDGSPAFREALANVVAAARAHRKAAGILARTQKQAEAYRQLGFSIIAIESDRGLLAKGFRNAVADFNP